MTTTQDDISDVQLLSTLKKAIDNFPSLHPEAKALNVVEYYLALELRKARAVAALAREGWRPIPNDEGAAISLFEPRSNPCRLILPVADGDAQQLAEQLYELADILVSLQIPNWPGRVLRAAELLVHQADLLAHQQEPASVPALSPRPPVTAIAPAPVLTRERPWERDGWCDEQGRCWMGDPGRREFIPSWWLCNPWDGSRLKWCLPHWAIPVPALGDAS